VRKFEAVLCPAVGTASYLAKCCKMTKLYRSYPHKIAGKEVKVFTLFACGISKKKTRYGHESAHLITWRYMNDFAVEAIPTHPALFLSELQQSYVNTKLHKS